MAQEARSPNCVLLGTQMFVALVRPSPHKPLPPATWHLLTERLARLAKRFRALAARVAAGASTPRPSRPAKPRPDKPRLAKPSLPTGRGWITLRIEAAAPCGGELHMLLQEPELPALVRAAPQAGRLLRPLCRALGVDLPDWLRLPPRQKTRQPSPCTSKPTTPRRPPAPIAQTRRASLPFWYPNPLRKQNNNA